MNSFLRIIAIVIELELLFAVLYHLFNGARLMILDLGISAKYQKAIIVAFATVGYLFVLFLISHLITFYPLL
jgi:succinate dehydrogenase/fumarate reductase cytochrome b subunit